MTDLPPLHARLYESTPEEIAEALRYLAMADAVAAALTRQPVAGDGMDAGEERFRIVEESQSAHCCFDFTVVDTSKPDIVGGKQYEGRFGLQFEAVCECFERADAELICNALNLAAPADTPTDGGEGES